MLPFLASTAKAAPVKREKGQGGEWKQRDNKRVDHLHVVLDNGTALRSMFHDMYSKIDIALPSASLHH